MSDSIPLLSPFKLGDLELKNRIAMAPMTRSRAGEIRVANELMAEYYEQRSSAGMIITEATTISEQANGWQNTPGIYTEEQISGWKKVTSRLQAKGTPIFLQLWHTGRAGHSYFQRNGELPVAPSAIKLEGDPVHTAEGKKDHEIPRALLESEIPSIVNDYKKSAANAKTAGFDGVEIHAANGYLIDQFLQSRTNKRTDGYGGSIEKRYRLLKEVVEAVCSVYPSQRVGVRLSPNSSFGDMGSTDNHEAFLYFAKELDQYNLGFLHVLRVPKDFIPFHGQGKEVQLLEWREVYSGTILVNGGYGSVAEAQSAIDAGEADLIAIGRPFITNPDLIERMTNGLPLASWQDTSVFYGFDRHNYTDFPFYE